MTRFLLATDSVHAAAAACDYLGGRLAEDDGVTALAVSAPGTSARDGEDASNVAAARLSGLATVETRSEAGEPAETVLEVAADVGADEVVIGARSGAPGTEVDLGSTAREVAARATVPVVVVPLPGLE